MDCEQALELISARMDHEIRPEDEPGLNAHLQECAACRAAVEVFSTQDAALRRAYVPCDQSAAGVTERVIAHLRTAPAQLRDTLPRVTMKNLFRTRLRRTMGWALAAAVVFGVGLGAGVGIVGLLPRHGQGQPQLGSGSDRDLGPVNVAGNTPPNVGELDYLTARRLPDAPAAKPLAIGNELKTKAGERRRVTLPDGSILYLNQNTTVRLAADRQVLVESGEVFVEVAPRGLVKKAGDPTFVVKTANREVTALGTKFSVKVEQAGTGVVVTQGKVKVDNNSLVAAGQSLKAGSNEVAPAQRASHLLDWTRELMAAAESPLVPASKHQGGALIAVDPYGQEARLSLRKYHIDVHIEDGFARTTIDQTYFNNNAWRMQGTFYFPLPADASLSRLAMYVADGKECNLMEGGMAERDYARDVYEQIVTRAQDPALLEWLDGSTFKMRVFPLEGRQEKRIVLSYTQKLDSSYGRQSYRFPGGHNLPVVGEWSFHARIKHGANTPVATPTHQLDVRPDGGDLVLNTSASAVKPDRDMSLEIADNTPNSESQAVRFSGATHEGAHYLMLRYRPSLSSPKQAQRRDWVFVFETSADRDPLLARAQIEIVRTVLNNAGHEDTFALIRAGTKSTAFAAEAKQVTPDNIKAGMEFLEKSHLLGALDMGKAIDEATKFTRVAQNPTIVHLGSGIPSLGSRNENDLVKRLPENVPFVGVGVGKRWARSFMKNAAERTGGAFVQINPDESISWRAFELFSLVNTPRLMNAKVIDNMEKAKFLTFGSTIAQGEELCAIARVKDVNELPKEVTIDGTFEGKPWRQTVPVNNIQGGADYLPRTWAKLEIDRLLAEDQEKNKKTIVDLSKQMYVMTPFTSLLVLENKAMYDQFKVDTGRKDHWALYPCPPKVKTVYEPIPGQGIDHRFAPQGAEVAASKPSANEVLQSILVRVPPQFFQVNQQGQFGAHAFTAYDLRGNAFALAEMGVEPQLDAAEAKDPGFAGKGGGRGVNAVAGERTGFGPAVVMPVDGFAPRMPPVSSSMPAFATGKKPPLMQDMLEKRVSNREFALRQLRARGDWDADEMEQVRWRNRRKGAFDRQLDSMPMIEQLAKQVSREGKGEGKGKGNGDGKKSAYEPVDMIIDRLMSGYTLASPMYQRPGFGGDHRVFYDLMSYAPGMNSTRADILGTVEAEAAGDSKTAPGSIDPKAAKLIEQARSAGWQLVTIPEQGRQSAFTVLFDGSGRFAYERTLPEGLKEKVVCDGKTLWHLYPELGLAARRAASRFHRAEFAGTVPWALQPAEDLARGNNITCLDERTVRIALKDAPKDKETQVALDLIFANGKLVERRFVELPSGKTLSRETYADGIVKLLDADGKVAAETRFQVEPAEWEAQLVPATKKLVVLSLPYRTQQHLWNVRKLNQHNYSQWDEAAALDMFASWSLSQNPWAASQVWKQRFFDKGVRSLGFATLFACTGYSVEGQQYGWSNLLTDQGSEPLARYLAVVSDHQRRGTNVQVGNLAGDKNGFVQQMAVFRDLYIHWTHGQKWHGSKEQVNVEAERALAYVRANKGSVRGWAILCQVLDHSSTLPREKLMAALQLFDNRSSVAYAARYEYARLALAGHETDRARKLFLDLHAEALKDGGLPAIDKDFRQAVTKDGKEPEAWAEFVQQTAQTLITSKRRPQVIQLAAQCRQLTDTLLADALITRALDNVPTEDRVATTLIAVEHLVQARQVKRADELMQPLLKDEKLNQDPQLWFLACSLTSRERVTLRSVLYLDKALELEYRHLPEVINVQQVRQDYSRLMNNYAHVVSALALVEMEAPKELVGQVIRAADRWRSLDTDPTMACQSAARILKQLGAHDLAWEYLVTPSAIRPNDSQTQLNLAYVLRNDGDYDLADKAFADAFEAEPTNAQILWERAQSLQQAGKTREAREVYRKLAEGKWQPRFQWIQQQSRYQLGVQ